MKQKISLETVSGLASLIEKQADKLAIIDTRGEEYFDKGHIPGAIHLAWEEWCAKPPAGLSEELNEPGYWGMLTAMDDEELSRRLSSLGFSNDKTIVVYADGKKSKGREGRISWMLLYFGANDVRILDGGYGAWVAGGGEIELAKSEPKPISVPENEFHVQRDESRRVLLQHLKDLMAEQPFPLLIDTRTKEEFEGDSYPYMPRTGTLPHAHLIPYAEVFKPDGTFINWDDFKSLLPSDSAKRKDTIAFCEVGVRACTVALLYEIYSGTKIPVYDGSIMEWGADPNLPMSRKLRAKS